MSTPSSTKDATSLWRVVAQREISTTLRSKGFIISGVVLVLGLVVMVVALTLTSGRPTTHDVAVVAGSGATDGAVVERAAQSLDEDDSIVTTSYEDTAALEQAVRDGDVDAALVATADGYEVLGDEEVDVALSQALAAAATAVSTESNAADQGVDLGQLAQGAQVSERLLDPGPEDDGLRQVASFVFVLLFFVTALTFGMQIAATVTQEKESRVVEILASAVPLRALLWGKVIGTTVLAVGQTVVLVLVGLVALLATGNTDALTVLGPALIWYVVFFVLGFVALASVWSVAGSLASRQQDLGATTAPLQLILFPPYFIAIFAGEQVLTIVSMLPIVSTMLMPSRLAQGDVPLWQLGVAVATTVLAAILLVRLGARIYEATLLRTGAKISYKEALGLGRS